MEQGNMFSAELKNAYISGITALLEQCNDLELFEILLQILQKSSFSENSQKLDRVG